MRVVLVQTGMFGTSCDLDEQMIASIAANGLGKPMLVLDCRPTVNAYANMMNGGGYESEKNYPHMRLHFAEIPNIHVVRSAHQHLKQAAAAPLPPAVVQAEDWTSVLTLILRAALLVVKTVDQDNATVLVHCSDGWDRTPQVTSLAMLMLDPFYRTASGFATLVEHEWVSMGHQFHTRQGHGSAQADNSQRSPIFLQWIDCVWQLMSQNVTAFCFGESLLLRLYEAFETCQFGNFLFDRSVQAVEEGSDTQSAWGWLLNHPDVKQREIDPSANGVLTVDPSLVRLWAAMHIQRWANGFSTSTVNASENAHREARGMFQQMADMTGTAVLGAVGAVFGHKGGAAAERGKEAKAPDGKVNASEQISKHADTVNASENSGVRGVSGATPNGTAVMGENGTAVLGAVFGHKGGEAQSAEVVAGQLDVDTASSNPNKASEPVVAYSGDWGIGGLLHKVNIFSGQDHDVVRLPFEDNDQKVCHDKVEVSHLPFSDESPTLGPVDMESARIDVVD